MTRLAVVFFMNNVQKIMGALYTIAGLAVALPSSPARALEMGPCAEVRAICDQAGFVQGAYREGNGLLLHCIRPIMQGIRQPPSARKPLPPVNSQLVRACRRSDPNFGRLRGVGPTGHGVVCYRRGCKPVILRPGCQIEQWHFGSSRVFCRGTK
jgi:hypothetical protein